MASTSKELQNDIRILQIIRAVAFLGGAVALVYFLYDKTLPVTITYITKDALVSESQTVFVTGLRNWFDAPIGYMAALALLVPSLSAVYRLTKGQEEYAKQVTKGSDNLKWLELGVSSALIIEVVALLAGVSDPLALKVSAGLLVITCALGWLADRQNQNLKKSEWSVYAISILSGALPWIFVVGTLAFTHVYGVVRLPWYSYALAGAVLVGSAGYAINQMLNIRRYDQWKQPSFVERNYLLIDIATKVAFAAILIIGLKG